MNVQRIGGMLLFLAGIAGMFIVLVAWMIGSIRDFQFWRSIWFPVVVMGVGIALIRLGDVEEQRPRKSRAPVPPRPVQGFPVIAGGPGRYHVSGVDRSTGMDTEWHVAAASEENARVKADLEGIAVTSVRFEGDML